MQFGQNWKIRGDWEKMIMRHLLRLNNTPNDLEWDFLIIKKPRTNQLVSFLLQNDST